MASRSIKTWQPFSVVLFVAARLLKTSLWQMKHLMTISNANSVVSLSERLQWPCIIPSLINYSATIMTHGINSSTIMEYFISSSKTQKRGKFKVWELIILIIHPLTQPKHMVICLLILMQIHVSILVASSVQYKLLR